MIPIVLSLALALGTAHAQGSAVSPLKDCAEVLRNRPYFEQCGAGKMLRETHDPYLTLTTLMGRPFFDFDYLAYACDLEGINVREDPFFVAQRGINIYVFERD